MMPLVHTGPALAVALAIGSGLLPLTAGVRASVLAVVIALVVVPHGAVDALSLRGSRRAYTAYIAGALAVFGAWWFAPSWALLGFLGLTVAHFAQGEAPWLHRSDRLTAFNRRLRAAARGVVTIAWPAAVWPGDVYSALAACSSAFNGNWMTSADVVGTVGLAVLAGTAAVLLVSWVLQPTGVPADALEHLGLAVVFVVARPEIAIGLYLALWHGWRHLIRVAALRSRSASFEALVETIRAAGVVVVVSVLGFAAVVSIAASARAPAEALLGWTLAALAAVTVPHVVIVTGLDHGWWGVAVGDTGDNTEAARG